MENPVEGLGDASVTMRQDGAQGASKDTLPVLLMVGSAAKGGAVDLPRVTAGNTDFESLARALNMMSAMYDQASCVAATHRLPL